jgi:vacuolar protein sorting-associated protein IST1
LGLGFSRLGRSSTPEKPKPTDAEDDDDDDYIDPGLDEAAAAIFYAWPRFPREVRELTTLRSLLMDRWGKDFATLAQDNKATIKVPERLVKRLRVKPPSTELVESYLREIAKAYGIAWPQGGQAVVAEGDIPEPMDREVEIDDQPQPPDYPDEDDNGGDVAAAPVTPQKKPVNLADMRRASEAEELSRATPPRDIGPHDVTGKSPVSVAPPKPSTDNPNPRVRIPGEQGSSTSEDAAASAARSPPATRPVAPQRKDSKGIPDVDELSKRFAALKR